METQSTELVRIVNESGLEKTKADYILQKFGNFFDLAADWQRKADTLLVTNINQVAEMKMAREGRLFLKQKRIEVEYTRKELKEQSLREGKAIDGVANVLKALIIPIEDYLEQQEKFAEIQEANYREIKRQTRFEELTKYEWIDTGFIDLGGLPEESYQSLFAGIKKTYNDRIAAEKKAEEERIAKEKAEAAERERIRQENERLKKEAIEREKLAEIERKKQAEILAKEKAKAETERKAMEEKNRKEREAAELEAKKEREIADAKLKAEQEAKAKMEAVLKARAEEDRKAMEEATAELKAKQEAERKAVAAPDKEKLLSFAKSISQIQPIELKTDEAKKIYENVKILVGKIRNYIETEVAKL